MDFVSAQYSQKGTKQMRGREYVPVSDRRVKESNEEKYRKDEPSSTCKQRHALMLSQGHREDNLSPPEVQKCAQSFASSRKKRQRMGVSLVTLQCAQCRRRRLTTHGIDWQDLQAIFDTDVDFRATGHERANTKIAQ